MLRPPEIRLPPLQRWSRLGLAASVGMHSLLLFVWIDGRVPDLPHRSSQVLFLAPPATGSAVVPMPYRVPRAEGREGTGLSAQRAARPVIRSEPQAVATLPEPRPQPQPVAPDTGGAPAARQRQPIGIIGPGLAEGHLWVRPLPLPPKDLAKRLTRDHVDLVDSAVTAIVQGYLDSIANDPSAHDVGLPSWTKNIAGKKFGIDGKNIYIAGLKIPAAVLALLPLSGGGNIDQNRAYNHLMDLRTDLQYAAQRSENLEEFKQMIKEMRLRKEREREFDANQRTAPPPENPPVP
ncbi:MAG: hypothetical protein ACREL3_09500 [Gemmatimonadales bacterium]